MSARFARVYLVALAICTVALAAAAIPAWGVEMTIAGMGAAGVVSGTVKISVTAPGTQEGYVILQVDGQFAEAQAPPFSFAWNSRLVEDGQHEISVVEINAAGDVVDRAAETVTVQNSADVTAPVTLAYKFEQGSTRRYAISGKTDITELAKEQWYELVPYDLYRSYAGQLQATATERTVSVQGGRAVIERDLEEGTVDFPDRKSRLLGVGRQGKITMSAAGAITDEAGAAKPESKFGAAWLGLPNEAVQRGMKWKSPVIFQLEMQDGLTQTVEADHEIVGFVKESGMDCALIQSTFRARATVKIAVGGETQTLKDIRVAGKRHTAFAINEGLIVRMEDKITGEFGVKASEYGVYAVGGPVVPGAAVGERRVIPEEIDLLLSLELTSEFKPEAPGRT